MNPGTIFQILKDTFSDWSEDKASRLAAALAYYTMFSLGPLLLIVVSIAGLVFGDEAARGAVADQTRGLMGEQGGEAVQTVIAAANRPSASIFASIIGIATLLFGAAGVFGQLQDALNTIWEVKPKPGRGVVGMIKDRFLSMTMVLGVGFLLLVSLVLSAGLSAAVNYLGGLLGGESAGILLQIVNFVVGFAAVTLLFALIYKVLPDVEIAWSDVWLGAAFTSLLFSVGRLAIGLYLGNAAIGSAWGAAGSIVVLLIWVYYSAQILFFGAEFTQVYANKYGSNVVPAENAVPVTEGERAQEGAPRKDERGAPRKEEKRAEGVARTSGAHQPAAPSNQSPSPLRAAVVVASAVVAAVMAGIGALRGRRGPEATE